MRIVRIRLGYRYVVGSSLGHFLLHVSCFHFRYVWLLAPRALHRFITYLSHSYFLSYSTAVIDSRRTSRARPSVQQELSTLPHPSFYARCPSLPRGVTGVPAPAASSRVLLSPPPSGSAHRTLRLETLSEGSLSLRLAYSIPPFSLCVATKVRSSSTWQTGHSMAGPPS